MMLYAFVLTVKYPKEYWVSEEYKITNNFNTSKNNSKVKSKSTE